MSRKSWPRISKRSNHGKSVYVVDARIGGAGERKFFSSKSEAEGFAQSCKVRRENEGESGFASQELARYGWTVSMAIRFALDHLRRQSASVPVSDAIEMLIAAKSATGRKLDYCNDLQRRLGRFSEFTNGKSMSAINSNDIEEFLRQLNVAPGTWNTYRRDLVTLWSYALKAGVVQTNEALKCERATDLDRVPGILTPEQTASLLQGCGESDVLAFYAIGSFAGLRVSEIMKLDWKDVNFESGFIQVSAETSKTRSRRLVPILPNLADWIGSIAEPKGKITGSNFRRRSTAVREAAGISPWPDNGLRHSFVSYRLAATNNAAQTALESGHDQDVLFAHYRELVRPVDAERYFAIRPNCSK